MNTTQNETQRQNNLNDFIKSVDSLESAVCVIRNFQSQVSNLQEMELKHFKKIEELQKENDRIVKVITGLNSFFQNIICHHELKEKVKDALILCKRAN